jgi:hypothetical protein
MVEPSGAGGRDCVPVPALAPPLHKHLCFSCLVVPSLFVMPLLLPLLKARSRLPLNSTFTGQPAYGSSGEFQGEKSTRFVLFQGTFILCLAILTLHGENRMTMKTNTVSGGSERVCKLPKLTQLQSGRAEAGWVCRWYFICCIFSLASGTPSRP